MKSVIVFGNVGVGGFEVDNRPVLMKWLAQQPVGTRFRATFEVTELDRRAKLIKFYQYVLLKQAGEHFGNDAGEQHRTFYGTITGVWNSVGDVQRNLDWMSDEELSMYVQDCVRVAATNGCTLSERQP